MIQWTIIGSGNGLALTRHSISVGYKSIIHHDRLSLLQEQNTSCFSHVWEAGWEICQLHIILIDWGLSYMILLRFLRQHIGCLIPLNVAWIILLFASEMLQIFNTWCKEIPRNRTMVYMLKWASDCWWQTVSYTVNGLCKIQFNTCPT